MRALLIVLLLSYNQYSFAEMAAGSTGAIADYWVVPDGSAVLQVYAEAGGDSYEVRIVSLREPHFTPADTYGVPGNERRDVNNPRVQLRTRPLRGLVIARGLHFDGERWRGGQIYDPDSGRTYRLEVQLAGNDFLKIRGYLGITLLGRTMYWQRQAVFQQRMTAMLAVY